MGIAGCPATKEKFMAKSQKTNSSGALRALRAVFLLLVLGCVGLAAYLFVIYPGMEPEEPEGDLLFAEGVYIDNIPLAGMTIEDARVSLARVEQEMIADLHFQLDAPGKSVTLTHADFSISFNTEDLLQEALLLGNEGSRKERSEAQEQLLESPRHFQIAYTVDVAPAAGKISELAAFVNKPPADASVEMDMETEGWFRYTDGIPGEALEEQALLDTLQSRASAGQHGAVELPISFEEPEITVEELRATLLLRAKAETSFRRSPYNRADRVFNVKKAAGFLNGFVLKPGEEFSTNDTFGPRTYELGWKPAPAYVNGATEDQAGGGVCQVSSTLYNAVVKSDLEITYRRNHSSTVSYVPYGLDATINTGTIDFTFKNNTESDIYIFAYTIDKDDGSIPEGMEDKTVHIEIYGEAFPEEYDEIRLTAEKIETLEPSGEIEYVVDNTAAWDYVNEEVTRRNGAVYQSYKHYYKDGVEIKMEPLAKSTYRAFAGRITVGPGYFQNQQLTAGADTQ